MTFLDTWEPRKSRGTESPLVSRCCLISFGSFVQFLPFFDPFLKIQLSEVDTFFVHRKEVRTEVRKPFFLLVALCVGIFAPTNAQAWDVCETAVETLEVAGEVTFTSSFCNCQNDDIITIEITPDDPSVTIDRVEFIKATPPLANQRKLGRTDRNHSPYCGSYSLQGNRQDQDHPLVGIYVHRGAHWGELSFLTG